MPHYSAADVLRQLLLDQGLVGDIDAGEWPSFVTHEPDSQDIPDNAITVYTTAGRIFSRSTPDSKRLQYPGFQIRVRSGKYQEGFDKAHELAEAIDGLNYETVTIDDDYHYLIHTVIRTGEVIPLGRESPTSQRSLFTINGMISYREFIPAIPVTLLTNLEAYYRFDGDKTDSSGNNRTLSGTATHSPGLLGSAADSAGAYANTILTRANDILPQETVSPYTISFWYRINTDGKVRLVFVDDAMWNNKTLEIGVNIPILGYININWNMSGSEFRLIELDTYNTWRHIVLSATEDTMTVYHDGVEVDTLPNPHPIGQNKLLEIWLYGGFTITRIDELGFWSRALTADEVLELYNAGNGFDPTA